MLVGESGDNSQTVRLEGGVSKPENKKSGFEKKSFIN